MLRPDRWMTMSEEKLEQNETSFLLSDEAPTEEELYDLAELFKVFGDSTRIKILYALLNADMSVGEMPRR